MSPDVRKCHAGATKVLATLGGWFTPSLGNVRKNAISNGVFGINRMLFFSPWFGMSLPMKISEPTWDKIIAYYQTKSHIDDYNWASFKQWVCTTYNVDKVYLGVEVELVFYLPRR
jgi:hypothetical protein